MIAANALLLLLASACQAPVPVGPASPSGAGAGPTGTTYYVSPAGNDSDSGTSSATPWATLSRVSSATYLGGDRILLQGGGVFPGTIVLDDLSQGTATAPITIGSYGTGRAVIDAGTGDAIFLYNTAGIVIRGLILRSSGRATSTGSGVDAFTDLASGTKLDFLRIDSVDASGFGQYGIAIGSWNGTAGFSNVTVTNVVASDNTLAGITSYAESAYAHQTVYVGHALAYNNPGRSGLTSPSGSGIVLGGVSGGTIERSVSHDNGWLSDAPSGPVGIWTYDSERMLIEHNESYANRTALADGGGFDFDQNTRYSTLQYNYSHNNAGPGLLLSQAPANTNHTGNVVRYNISENDARVGSAGAITVYGMPLSAEIHDNTVYVTPSSGAVPRAIFIHNYTIPSNVSKNVHVRNNIFYTKGGVRLAEVSPGQLTEGTGLRFEGNSYYPGGSAFTIRWGSQTYSSLVQWRGATGEERLAGASLGFQGNPGLTAPGKGGTIGNADLLGNLNAYKLAGTSALINKGLNLFARFGVPMPPMDFYNGAAPHGSGYDIGAHEWR